MNNKLKKIWVDPVWSKVIATGITAIGSAVCFSLYSLIAKIPIQILFESLLSTQVTMKLWMLAGLGVVAIALLLFAFRLWPFNAGPARSSIVSGRRHKNEEENKLWGPDQGITTFFSIAKIKSLAESERLPRVRRFLVGRWSVRYKKGRNEISAEHEIIELSDGRIMRRESNGPYGKDEVQLAQIEFAADTSTISWKLFDLKTRRVLGKETLTVQNNEDMTGMESSGQIVSYKRINLYKSID